MSKDEKGTDEGITADDVKKAAGTVGTVTAVIGGIASAVVGLLTLFGGSKK